MIEKYLVEIKIEQGKIERDVFVMKEKQNFQDNLKWNVELGKVKKDVKNDVSTKVTKIFLRR